MFKCYQLKVQGKHSYFTRLFTEAKWWYNFALQSDDLKTFDTKQKIVTVKRGDVYEAEPLHCLSSQMKQNLYFRMWESIKGLSAKKRQGAKVGKLKFRSFVNAIPLSNQTFRFKNGRLKLEKCKQTFRVLGFHQLPQELDIRKGELIRKPSGIYLSVTVKVPDEEQPEPKRCVGVDMGISKALNFHDGTTVSYAADKRLERGIRTAQRRISRKEKGSRNRKKAQAKLRRLEERRNNQKTDAANQLFSKLKPYQVFMQDELLTAWKRRFGKTMQHNIHGRIKAKLKTSSATVMLARSVPTTQYCPECERLNKHDLSERVYRCDCGYTENRDKHAANNMIRLGRTDCSIQVKMPVEPVSDLYSILADMECKRLVVKQEFPSIALA